MHNCYNQFQIFDEEGRTYSALRKLGDLLSDGADVLSDSCYGKEKRERGKIESLHDHCSQ